MAIVSASLRMFDMMTQPLLQVSSVLNDATSKMDRLANSANQNINLEKSLNNIYTATERTNEILTELSNSQNKAANNQNKLNDSFNRGSNSVGNLVNKVKGLIGTYLGFQAAKKGIEATIGGAMSLQQQLFTIQGIMGNKDVGTAYFNNLQKKANESVFAFEDFANNARKYMQFTKNTDSLDKLANLSERLTLMDPTQGLQGAGFALKEMMSGDGISLKERFGFGKAEIEILKASKGMDDFIAKFDKLLNKKGFTESMLQQYNSSASAQFDNLQSNFKTALAEAGSRALEILAPVITKINQTFASGGFQNFFDSISRGIAYVVDFGLKAIEVVSNVGKWVKSNWDVIGPIISGAVAAIITLKGAMIAYSIAQGINVILQTIHAISLARSTGATIAEIAAKEKLTVAQWALNGSILACPLTWVVIAIVAVITALIAWSAHTNGLKATWLIFADALITSWDVLKITAFKVVYGIMDMWDSLCIKSYALAVNIQNALGNMKAGGLMIVQDFVNGAIELINKLINMVNKIPGVSIEAISKVTFGTEAAAENELAKAARNRELQEFKLGKDKARQERQNKLDNTLNRATDNYIVRQINIETAKEEHAKGNSGIKLPKIPEIPNIDSWNKMQGPGELSTGLNDANKHLKGINDKIDISNEHLEMLRDFAEEKSISNFTTLTPTISFGNVEVKEEADINKIISKIETYMENELANSAEGVYA